MTETFSILYEQEIDTLVLRLEINQKLRSRLSSPIHNKVLKKMRSAYKKEHGIKNARDVISRKKANIKWASEITKLVTELQAEKDIELEIKAVWPNAWGYNEWGYTKNRKNLKRNYRKYIDRKIWEAQNLNATCSNCANLAAHPNDNSIKICGLQSDFLGNFIIKNPEHEDCMKWAALS